MLLDLLSYCANFLNRLPMEEMESRYNRIVTGSLNAYATFFDQIAQPPIITRKDKDGKLAVHDISTSWKHISSTLEKTKEIHVEILNDGKFWKLSQSKIIEVNYIY